MKEILNKSLEYFDKYFIERGFKRKRKWNYIIPVEKGFMKGVYVKPHSIKGTYEFFPVFTIQHDAIGEIIWNGYELIRYKGKGAGGTAQYKFHDTKLIAATFANVINLPSGMMRTIFDYRFDSHEKATRVCELVCDDFEQNADKFYGATDSMEKIFKVMEFGNETFIYPNFLGLMATYLYLEMGKELDELIEKIDREEEKESRIILKNYISDLRGK